MDSSAWAAWWTEALGHAPNFTWLFVQDHRGGQQSPQHVAAYYAALAPALRPLNVTFWANAELFHIVADTVLGGVDFLGGRRGEPTSLIGRLRRRGQRDADAGLH